jgi:hypothetical protein
MRAAKWRVRKNAEYWGNWGFWQIEMEGGGAGSVGGIFNRRERRGSRGRREFKILDLKLQMETYDIVGGLACGAGWN